MSASNCVTRSSGVLGAVDELGRLRGALDGGGEVGLGHRLLPHLDPLPERAQVRRGVAAGAQPVALEDRRAEARRSRTCRWCRPRGSRRSGAAAARARSSACACGRGRSACRTARGRAGTPRPRGRSLGLQPAQRLAVLLELARAPPPPPPRARARTNCSLASLRSARSISAASCSRRAARRRSRLGGVEGVRGQHLHPAAGHRHGREHVAVRSVVADELEAREPAEVRRPARRSRRRPAARAGIADGLAPTSSR